MATNTYRIVSMATAAEGDALTPALLPDAGTLVDWTDVGLADWTEVPFKFTNDSWEFEYADQQRLVIKPPDSPVKTDVIRNNVALDMIRATAYEVGEKVIQIAGNASESSGTWTFSSTFTRKAIAIEWGKYGVLYCPSVEIEVKIPNGAIWELGTQVVEIEVFGTDSIPTGYQWLELQPGA